nr:DMT family transporter [Actinomycetota bacterium]
MHPRPVRDVVAVAGSLLSAFVVGGFVAVQSHINGALAVELGATVTSAAVAAVISFGTGLVLLCLICGLTPGPRRGLLRIARAARDRRLPPWQLVG